MPTVFHSAKCLCCMRFQSNVAEKVKDAKMRDAKEAKARGMMAIKAERKRKREAERERDMMAIKAERKRKREAEREAMMAARRGGPRGVVRRLRMVE
jgi:hypothetical protein